MIFFVVTNKYCFHPQIANFSIQSNHHYSLSMPELKARKQLTRFRALSTLNQNENLLKTRSTEAKLRI